MNQKNGCFKGISKCSILAPTATCNCIDCANADTQTTYSNGACSVLYLRTPFTLLCRLIALASCLILCSCSDLSIPISTSPSSTQEMSFSPATLAFPAETVGTKSESQMLTLLNDRSESLAITQIAALGDYSQTNTCGSTVAAGGRCVITVTFTPTVAGTRTGSVTVTDKASILPQTVSLSGTGTVPLQKGSLSHATLVFPGQAEGTTSASQSLTFLNGGSTLVSLLNGEPPAPRIPQTTYNNTATPEQYGAVHDGITVTDANCAGGSTTLTTANSAPFTSTAVDAGKTIVVNGCGELTAASIGESGSLRPTSFVSTIVSVNSSQSIIMAAAPPTNAGIVTSITYISGITTLGRNAQTCILTLPNGGTATLYLSANNTIISGTTATITTLDKGESTPPMTARVAPGSASACSGTPIITSTLATASATGQWMAFGTNDHDAIESCIKNGTIANGRCHLADDATYLVSTPSVGVNTGRGVIGIGGGAKGIDGGLLDGKATLIYAPVAPFTPGINDRLLYPGSRFISCPSGTSICPISTSPLSAGSASFTTTYSSDAEALTPGDYLIIAEQYPGGVGYTDWVQVKSVSDSTVTLTQPFRMDFPCSETVVPGSIGCGFWRVSSLTNNLTLKDFTITIPNQYDGTGRSIAAITTSGTRGLTLENISCYTDASSCIMAVWDSSLTLDRVQFMAESIAPEIAANVDLIITAGSKFARQPIALNSFHAGCSSGRQGAGLLLDLGTGFYSINGVEISNACQDGIMGEFGVHDGSISNSNIGMLGYAVPGYSSYGIGFIGGYNNFLMGNTMAGSGAPGAIGIRSATDNSPLIESTNNVLVNNEINTGLNGFSGGAYMLDGPTDEVLPGYSTIAVSGDFAQSNTCGLRVKAGSSCTFLVTFTPTAVGTRGGSLTIIDSVSGSAQTASLSGEGLAVTNSEEKQPASSISSGHR